MHKFDCNYIGFALNKISAFDFLSTVLKPLIFINALELKIITFYVYFCLFISFEFAKK